MNKQDLIDSIAAASEISKASATRALDALIDNVTNSLGRGESVVVIGFGTFDVSHRKARTGRNPQTGQSIQIPASKVARFKAGKALKDQLNKK